MADKKKAVSKRKIVLTSGTTATILMNFSPDVNLDNPCSRNYNAALWFEYNEHPNKVRSPEICIAKTSSRSVQRTNYILSFVSRIKFRAKAP